MWVEAQERSSGFRYRLTLDADERIALRRSRDSESRSIPVESGYGVRLPESFERIHADTHALAIWLALRGAVSSELRLSFPVSEAFAERMQRRVGITLPNVDPVLRPREEPSEERPALLFTGGVASLAAALVMPRDTAVLFVDRLAGLPPGPGDSSSDPAPALHQQKKLCALLRRRGWDVQFTPDDHEDLFDPGPHLPASDGLLPMLYFADSLGLNIGAPGDELCPPSANPHHDGAAPEWRLPRPLPSRAGPGGGLRACEPACLGDLSLARVRPSFPIIGLSEIGAAMIVNQSHLKGRSSCCRFPSGGNYCLRCDRCFRTLLSEHVLDDREVPAALFAHFISSPSLAGIFSDAYFDQHHLWYYLFQKMRCGHPLARELHRQASDGPDLTLFEKWLPTVDTLIPATYRDEVVENIGSTVETMTPGDIAELETLVVPPLHAPEELLSQEAARTSSRVVYPVGVGDSRPEPGAEEQEPPVAPESPPLARWSAEPGDEELERHIRRTLVDSVECGLVPGFDIDDLRVARSAELLLVEFRLREHSAALAIEWREIAPPPSARCRFAHSLRWLDAPGERDYAVERVVRLVAAGLDSRSWRDGNALAIADLERHTLGSPLQRRIEISALRTDHATRGGAGFRTFWPVTTRRGAVLSSLFDGEEWVDLIFEERDAATRSFSASERTAMSYFSNTPIDSPQKSSAARRFLRMIQEAEGAQRGPR